MRVLCIQCGGECTAKTVKRAFCCNACRQAAYRERHPKSKKPKPAYPGLSHAEAWAKANAKP